MPTSEKNSRSIEQYLSSLCAEGLDRSLRPLPESGSHIRMGGREYINFSSNDYLGLSQHPLVVEGSCEAARQWGAGSRASRLVIGTLEIHCELERELAAFLKKEAALVLGAGYLANLAAVTSLVGRGDFVVADRAIHASLVDAAKLSGAKFLRFRHNDISHLEECLVQATAMGSGRVLVMTESVFSMDGDIAPITQIVALAEKYSAMVLVDEAHAIGLFGELGEGVVAELGLSEKVDVITATMSKSLGSFGGVIACSEQLERLIINRARSFIYSTALPPSVVGSARAALGLLQSGVVHGKNVLDHARFFSAAISSAGLPQGRAQSQIVPLVVGENAPTLLLAELLQEEGILAVAIRSPTVPKGKSRIRFSFTQGHTKSDIERLVAAVVSLWSKVSS